MSQVKVRMRVRALLDTRFGPSDDEDHAVVRQNHSVRTRIRA